MPQSTHITYFTCHIENAGLADYLERFNVCHKLGLSLGYQYVHTPFSIPRSSDNIEGFLGFTDYFPLKAGDPGLENCLSVRIDLNSLFKNNEFHTLQELQDCIRQVVSEISISNEKRVIVSFRLDRSKLSRKFSKKGLFSRISRRLNKNWRQKYQQSLVSKLALWLHSPQPAHLDFRSIYFQAREKQPRKSRFTDDKVKLVVHIRQGDTALIETPWHTFLPLWKINKSTELAYLDHAGDKYIHTHDYFSFLNQFLTYFDASTFSIIVSSDGYKRGFRKIYQYRHRFNFTDEQLQALRKAEKTYDQEKFAKFETLENCLCLVGETDENLFDLIHSTLIADIIIIGTQQRMLPNLLALYSDPKNPPIVIVLHKSGKPPGHVYTVLDRRAEIIPVKLGEMDLEYVVSSVLKRFRQRIIT